MERKYQETLIRPDGSVVKIRVDLETSELLRDMKELYWSIYDRYKKYYYTKAIAAITKDLNTVKLMKDKLEEFIIKNS